MSLILLLLLSAPPCGERVRGQPDILGRKLLRLACVITTVELPHWETLLPDALAIGALLLTTRMGIAPNCWAPFVDTLRTAQTKRAFNAAGEDTRACFKG